MVVLEGVRKRYSRVGHWVLDGVDLTVEPGVSTVVVAGNGVGKSTLLRIVAGASLPTAGRVIGRPPVVGYVPERAPAALRMTARQYLRHIGRMRGVRSDARAEALADRLGLHPGLDVPVTSLSKGNGQKVAVMQAFLAPPELLVLDEPQTGLDAAGAEQVDLLVREAQRDGAAVVRSAHRRTVPPDARVFRLADGKLLADSAQGMRVVLRARRAGLSLSQFDGLAEVESAEAGWVTLRTADADRLLVRALPAGWSLVEARP